MTDISSKVKAQVLKQDKTVELKAPTEAPKAEGELKAVDDKKIKTGTELKTGAAEAKVEKKLYTVIGQQKVSTEEDEVTICLHQNGKKFYFKKTANGNLTMVFLKD